MSDITIERSLCIIEMLLGHRPDRLEEFRPRVGGNDSQCFRMWEDGNMMLLQVKRRAGTPFGVHFHSQIKKAGIPAPELVAFSKDAGPNGEAAAIWEWIDGEPAEWGPNEACPYDEAELGELPRRIHDLEFEGAFGFLGDDSSNRSYAYAPDIGPVSTSWPEFFHCDEAAHRYLDRGYLDQHEADILSSLPDRLCGELSREKPRLLHMGDIMHSGNLIVGPTAGRIAAVIDYSESLAGDPRWELAWFDYYFEQFPFYGVDFDMDRFRAAYGTDHDSTDILGRFYLLAILVFEKLLFFDPHTPKGRWAIKTAKSILSSFDGK